VSNFAADLRPCLFLEIDIGERLAVVVADDEAGGLFLDRPRWWEAAFCHGRKLIRCVIRTKPRMPSADNASIQAITRRPA